MKISNRNTKVLFIILINVVLAIPFFIYLTTYFTKSYCITENDLVVVDTVSFKYVSDEITVTKGSRRIEMTASNNQEFRIWNISIDAIKDKQVFLDKIKNPESKVVIYSDQKSANKYKNGKSNFTSVKQVEIEKIKFIDIDKVNTGEKNIALRYIFICPLLGLFLTFFFQRKLLKQQV